MVPVSTRLAPQGYMFCFGFALSLSLSLIALPGWCSLWSSASLAHAPAPNHALVIHHVLRPLLKAVVLSSSSLDYWVLIRYCKSSFVNFSVFVCVPICDFRLSVLILPEPWNLKRGCLQFGVACVWDASSRANEWEESVSLPRIFPVDHWNPLWHLCLAILQMISILIKLLLWVWRVTCEQQTHRIWVWL